MRKVWMLLWERRIRDALSKKMILCLILVFFFNLIINAGGGGGLWDKRDKSEGQNSGTWIYWFPSSLTFWWTPGMLTPL